MAWLCDWPERLAAHGVDARVPEWADSRRLNIVSATRARSEITMEGRGYVLWITCHGAARALTQRTLWAWCSIYSAQARTPTRGILTVNRI
jgi:hypothetical protein